MGFENPSFDKQPEPTENIPDQTGLTDEDDEQLEGKDLEEFKFLERVSSWLVSDDGNPELEAEIRRGHARTVDLVQRLTDMMWAAREISLEQREQKLVSAGITEFRR